MVRRHHGNWHRFGPPPQSPLQRQLAVLELCCDLLLEHWALRHVHSNLNGSIHGISRNMAGHGPASSAVPLSWHFPNGLGDHHQHDCFRVRTSLGRRGCEARE